MRYMAMAPKKSHQGTSSPFLLQNWASSSKTYLSIIMLAGRFRYVTAFLSDLQQF